MRQMKVNLLVFFIAIISLSFVCYAEEDSQKAATDITNSSNDPEDKMVVMPEDHYFNVEAIFAKEDEERRFQFHGYFEITSPIKGRDDDSQQPSSKFPEENDLVLWAGKQLSKRLFFDSEVEIKKGFKKYTLEKCEFDYEMIDKLVVFRVGKFIYPFGIERRAEDGPLNKLVDRPLPSIRIIPGTYSDIGGMFYGTVPFPGDARMKYEIAVTNGLNGPDPKDVQQLWDNNSNKAIGGRLGYEFLPGLEIGSSYLWGKYDKHNTLDIDFLGVDMLFKRGNLEVRGEYITSRVEQNEADGGDYSRNGYYLQTSYKYPFHLDYLRYLEGVLRFDSVDPNRKVTDGYEADRIAVGINYFPIDHVEIKLEYEVENEPGEGIHGKSFVQAIFSW